MFSTSHIKPYITGKAGAVVLGTFHALWIILVYFGWAQNLLNFIFKLHMIRPPYILAPFNWAFAIELVLLTTLIGYVLGWGIGVVWNYTAGKKR